MKKIMSDYRERTRKEFLLPSSVQELIPIVKISRDGIFQLEKGSEEEEKQYVPAIVIGERYLFAGDEIIAQLAEALTAGEGLQTPLLNGAERQP